MEDVIRVLAMRDEKPVLAQLVKQGTVGDDIWTQFTLSEKELEAEIMAVIEEANTFKEGWGQTILQTASEMVQHERTKHLQKDLVERKEQEARKQAVLEQRKDQSKTPKKKKAAAKQESDEIEA
ncbi:translocation protein S66 [Lunasporangiospora selenospora]|uniref:Translocation protein S66 n=1 Tax=Lunasporangiospora selenospora TaxID=979761 RepID=A0A9P6FPN2_9FUNG|nr:translocation protein S66 [Lunasporangiospora selenospora]